MTYTKEQQAENRRKWVAALRSGEFQQTRNVLRNEDGYCCLGVAAELAAREGVAVRTAPDERDGNWLYNDDPTRLAPKLRHWLGINSPRGVLRTPIYDGHIVSLDGLNDICGFSFEQIADVIESDGVALEGDPL